jgi:multidrug efflux system membrane fusion protein
VFALDNQVDLATGTLKIKALYENSDQSLFPNQFVNVRLFVDTLHNVILAPSASIQRGIQGDYVYVVKDDSTVELRLIDILAAQGDITALRKGLQPGETVVTDGIERLRPGARVTIPGAEPPQGNVQGSVQGGAQGGPGRPQGNQGAPAGDGAGRGQRQGRTGS